MKFLVNNLNKSKFEKFKYLTLLVDFPLPLFCLLNESIIAEQRCVCVCMHVKSSAVNF